MTRCKYVVALALVAAGLVQMGFAQFIEKENLLARHFPTKERYLANIVALRFNGSTDLGYGETHELNVITQFYETGPVYITESHLGLNSGALYDSSTPPTNVTDADVQAEVLKMTNNSPRTDTVYEVFLPASSYSSDGSYTSCGGPHLTYCAYHGNFSHGSYDVKYASMPYPSCGGCQSSGFSTMQNFEHFISHETREAVNRS